MTLLLAGRIPSKKNSKRFIQRGASRFLVPSEAYEVWHEEMMLRIRQFRPQEPIKKASISLTFYAPDKIKSDLTNKAESCMDLLVDAGILVDDSWFVAAPVHLHFGGVDRTNPRCEIVITPEA